MTQSLFITFEGPEGSGKSTQIKLLQAHFAGRGIETVITREPGGTPVGEKIRDILLSPESEGLSPVAELLLYAASRNQHIAGKIAPAMADGITVLCDRYADATTAYQGAARKIEMSAIDCVHKVAKKASTSW